MLVYGWNKMPVDGGIDDSMDKYVVVVVHKQRWDATTHTGRRAEVAGASCLTFSFCVRRPPRTSARPTTTERSWASQKRRLPSLILKNITIKVWHVCKGPQKASFCLLPHPTFVCPLFIPSYSLFLLLCYRWYINSVITRHAFPS